MHDRERRDRERSHRDHDDGSQADRGDHEAQRAKRVEDQHVGPCHPAIASAEARHRVAARLPEQRRDRDQLEAGVAKPVDQAGQGGHRIPPIASAVVQQHDVAVSITCLLEHRCDDLLGARRRVVVRGSPVVGVDLRADDRIAELLGVAQSFQSSGRNGLIIDAVRRSKEPCADAQPALDQPLGEHELELQLRGGHFLEVGVRIGVIADLVSLGVDALEQTRRLIGGEAGHEERGRDVLRPQHVEDAGREARVRAVVEGERDLPRRASSLLDLEGMRVAREVLVDDRSRGGVAADVAPPRLRGSGDLPDVAVAVADDLRNLVGRYVL